MPGRKLALVLAGFCSVASAAPSLYITTEHPLTQGTPPHVAPSRLAERVGQIALRAGVRYTLQQYPWKRAFAMALEQPNGCVYATSRTPEREALFKWAGPFHENEWILAGLAGRDYGIKTLADARKYRIGTYNGDARHEYLSARGFNVDPAQTDIVNAQKLLMGRIDLWASALPKGALADFSAHLPDNIVPVLSFRTVGLYMACNRNVPDAVVARMSSAMQALDREDAQRAARRPSRPPPDRRASRPPCLLPAETSSRNCE